MKRLLVACAGVCAIAVALVTQHHATANAAPKPNPTPTPVALQYDEIDRIVIAPATAPPPGSFQSDYTLAMQGGSTPVAAAATPTPQPRHRGLGGMIGNVLSGNIAGAAAQTATENIDPSVAMPGMPNMDAFNQLRTGRVTRYTFYYTRGWVREDDPVAQTATISKCNEHEFISLDLKNKTYRKSNTQAAVCNTPGMPHGHPGQAGAPAAPGTVDLTVSTQSQNLGPRTLEGIGTTGYSDTTSMTMANATGSCHNAQFDMALVQYISNINKPRAYCPLTRTMATGPQSFADGNGGCKPTLHTNGGVALGHGDKLEMYTKMTMSGARGGGQSFANVMQRGHVNWLYRAQADPLFEIPPGFTQQG